MEKTNNLLSVKDLIVRYNTDDAVVHALNGVSLKVNRGETMGLVGETGAGKTTLALSILKVLPEKVGEICGGSIEFDGEDIISMPDKKMRNIRGRGISMIFQDSMTSLNPVISVGSQIEELLDLHFKEMSKQEKAKKVDNILRLVGIPPERKNEYPFQFSGGMKQRIVIAMALICEPKLLIADEPTSALDVTIQAQILELMKQLQNDFSTSVIMITHDLGIVAEICDKVSIMYAGEIVETGSVEEIFKREDMHPYTQGLFECIPDIDSDKDRLTPIPGQVVDPTDLTSGCMFHERCKMATERCRTENPKTYTCNGHSIKCFLYEKWGEEIVEK